MDKIITDLDELDEFISIEASLDEDWGKEAKKYLETLFTDLENAKYAIEDLEQQLYDSQEKVAAEFEGEASKVLGALLKECDLNHYTSDEGWTADSAYQAILETINSLEVDLNRANDKLKTAVQVPEIMMPLVSAVLARTSGVIPFTPTDAAVKEVMSWTHCSEHVAWEALNSAFNVMEQEKFYPDK